MKSIGDRLGRQKKTKQENLWDWIKSKMNRHILLYIGGYRIVNS